MSARHYPIVCLHVFIRTLKIAAGKQKPPRSLDLYVCLWHHPCKPNLSTYKPLSQHVDLEGKLQTTISRRTTKPQKISNNHTTLAKLANAWKPVHCTNCTTSCSVFDGCPAPPHIRELADSSKHEQQHITPFLLVYVCCVPILVHSCILALV